jgi:hypothetical protein
MARDLQSEVDRPVQRQRQVGQDHRHPEVPAQNG